MTPANLTFHIRTYGCQMNERDSEALACMLEQCGYQRAASEDVADILLFNTCSVRDQAERKAIGKVGILKRLKRERPEIIIGVIGCMAQNYGRRLLDELPHVDVVVGTDRLHLLPEILADVLGGHRGQVHTEPGTEVLGRLRGHEKGKVSAFISVMRGCNQFCTYCIVPYVRGREKSRSIEAIVAEVEEVVANGAREIFLLGQNITAYGVAELRQQKRWTGQESPLADLLRAVDAVPGVARLRFTSPHPKYMNDVFIEAITTLPSVCEAFHVPLQSGCDRLLTAMHRGYSSVDYLNRIAAIRSGRPGSVFTTDVIVGFPGEGDDDFAATRQVMETVGFEMAYVFKYSPRDGTKAASLADDVPQEVKEARNQLLLQDLAARSEAANQKRVGTEVGVLVEGPSKRNAARWTGRSRTGKVCIFDPAPDTTAGDIVTIRVTRATANSLYGTLAPVPD